MKHNNCAVTGIGQNRYRPCAQAECLKLVGQGIYCPKHYEVNEQRESQMKSDNTRTAKMTKSQVKTVKQQILGLRWDANIKNAKADRLTKKLCATDNAFRFTASDFKAFFASRGITPPKG